LLGASDDENDGENQKDAKVSGEEHSRSVEKIGKVSTDKSR
jgi:hypothetical protein